MPATHPERTVSPIESDASSTSAPTAPAVGGELGGWPPPIEVSTTVTSFETWFGAAESPLFGSVHHRADGTARGAVVLCSPLAKEHINTYRGVRQLAEKLAADGLLVLRFDYRGHGDSAGRQDDPEAATHWIRSIGEAVTYVRSAGVDDVSVVGLRAGALLAANAAQDIGPLRSMVLWDPTLSGRSYVREASTLYRMTVGADSPDDPRVSVLGGAFAPEAIDALRSMTVDSAAIRACTESVMVVVREENVDSRPVTDLVQATDAFVSVALAHNAFVNPPSFVFATPTPTITAISEWIGQTMPALTVPIHPRRCTEVTFATDTGARIVETIENRGEHRLLTLITRPATPRTVDHGADAVITADAISDPPLVVLYSTASEHRIGPVRLWVETARQLGAAGVTAVRFDRRGTGDSGEVAENESTPAMSGRGRADVRAVVESFRSDPARTMHVGMCSGSWHAAYAANMYGAAAVLTLNMVNWSFRKRRTPVKAATVAAMESRTADRAFAAAKVVRNRVRAVQASLPYPLWKALGRAGAVSAPEAVLAPLVDKGIRTVVVLSPEDHDWFVANRGEQGLTAIRERGTDLEVNVYESGDHSLYHRDLRTTVAAKILTEVSETFSIPIPQLKPIVAVGVEKI